MIETFGACSLCGGTAGRKLDGAHALCTELAKLGRPTPSLGDRCDACHGSGHKPLTAAGPMLDFNLGPAKIARAINAWANPCPACHGTGTIK